VAPPLGHVAGTKETTRSETPPILPTPDSSPSKDASSWHLIVDSALPEIVVAPFDHFVAIASRSLFLIVDGTRTSFWK